MTVLGRANLASNASTRSHPVLMPAKSRESLMERVSFPSSPLPASPEKLGVKIEGGLKSPTGLFLNDYGQLVLERDVAQAAGIQKVPQFLKFVTLLAGRAANILELSTDRLRSPCPAAGPTSCSSARTVTPLSWARWSTANYARRSTGNGYAGSLSGTIRSLTSAT